VATKNEEVSAKITQILPGSLKISRNFHECKVSLVYFCDFNGESVAEDIEANFCLAWLRISLFSVPYSTQFLNFKDAKKGAKKKLLMTFPTKNLVKLSD